MGIWKNILELSGHLIEATLQNSGHALVSEDILQHAINYGFKPDYRQLTIISNKDQYQK